MFIQSSIFAILAVAVAATDNIAQIVKDDSSLDLLYDALKITGLDDVLGGDGPFTVLAPTDSAFRDLLRHLDLQKLEDIPEDTLAAVLKYHVLAGEVLSDDLEDGIVKPISGQNLLVNVYHRRGRERIVFNEDSSVTTKDIKASNGIIHKIDEVLLAPKNLIGMIEDDSRFDILYHCLVVAGLELPAEGEFTIFAPKNAAFRNLFRNLGIGGCEDLDTESLTAVLLYHIVAGEALKDDLKDGDEIKTLGGSSVHVEFRRKRRNLLVNDVRVSDSDIIAADGIIHKINEVLLPE